MPQGIIPAGDYPSETHRLEIIPDGVFPRPLAAVNAFGPRVRYGLGVGRSRALFYAPLSRFLAPSLALAAGEAAVVDGRSVESTQWESAGTP